MVSISMRLRIEMAMLSVRNTTWVNMNRTASYLKNRIRLIRNRLIIHAGIKAVEVLAVKNSHPAGILPGKCLGKGKRAQHKKHDAKNSRQFLLPMYFFHAVLRLSFPIVTSRLVHLRTFCFGGRLEVTKVNIGNLGAQISVPLGFMLNLAQNITCRNPFYFFILL